MASRKILEIPITRPIIMIWKARGLMTPELVMALAMGFLSSGAKSPVISLCIRSFSLCAFRMEYPFRIPQFTNHMPQTSATYMPMVA